MIVKSFFNFINEQIDPDKECEKDDKGKKILDKQGNPVIYYRKQNPVFWEVEKNLDKLKGKFKGYEPELTDKHPTPTGGHHKIIQIGESAGDTLNSGRFNAYDSEYSQLIMVLHSRFPILKIRTTVPNNPKSTKWIIDQKEENDIKEILSKHGLKDVEIKFNLTSKNNGFTQIAGTYDNYQQLIDTIDDVASNYGHFIWVGKGKTLQPLPSEKS